MTAVVPAAMMARVKGLEVEPQFTVYIAIAKVIIMIVGMQPIVLLNMNMKRACHQPVLVTSPQLVAVKVKPAMTTRYHNIYGHAHEHDRQWVWPTMGMVWEYYVACATQLVW